MFLNKSDLFKVLYFWSFNSWIFIVLENNSLTLAFMNGISRIFLIDGRLFGSFINISDKSFFKSEL